LRLVYSDEGERESLGRTLPAWLAIAPAATTDSPPRLREVHDARRRARRDGACDPMTIRAVIHLRP